MQNIGVTNKEHYGMIWYFLKWSIVGFSVLYIKKNKNKQKKETELFWRWHANDKLKTTSSHWL